MGLKGFRASRIEFDFHRLNEDPRNRVAENPKKAEKQSVEQLFSRRRCERHAFVPTMCSFKTKADRLYSWSIFSAIAGHGIRRYDD
jgi:hypothetical protein